MVLRAARLGTNALELLGLVLARRLIADSLPASIRPFGWLLLDDFGNWLGHRGGEVADLLALALHDGDGELTAELFVVESKFVGEAACSEEARKSRRQLERTMDGLIHRLFNGENPRPCQEDQAEGHEEVRPVLPGCNVVELTISVLATSNPPSSPTWPRQDIMQTKAGRLYHAAVPVELTAYVEDYLQVHRLRLQAAANP